MTLTFQENIEHFFKWVGNRRAEIDTYPDDYNYRTILLLALLDTLSKCAFPKEKQNKIRFVKLIDEFSNWEDRNLVSLPQLQYLLDDSLEYAHCKKLEREVKAKISKWKSGAVLAARERDPLADELKAIDNWNDECLRLIEKARYASLLWILRNSAVHTFSNPGRDAFNRAQHWREPAAFYMRFCPEPAQQPQHYIWRLIIPVEVLSKIVLDTSEHLKKHFAENKTDPFASFNFEPSWYKF